MALTLACKPSKPKGKVIRSAAIRNAARGEECTIQSAWCNHDPETTVYAHSNRGSHGKGMGRKADDIFGVFACSSCHAMMDGIRIDAETFLRAHARTLHRLVDLGLVVVK